MEVDHLFNNMLIAIGLITIFLAGYCVISVGTDEGLAVLFSFQGAGFGLFLIIYAIIQKRKDQKKHLEKLAREKKEKENQD